jgi:hypothetical protein
MALEEEQAMGDQSYFDGFEGQGLEGFTQDTVATAYLGMVQPGSTASTTDQPGTWRNSATGENYGPIVSVVPLAFKTVWTERMSQPPYSTVSRYEPYSIDVETTQPKPGQRGFPKMINPVTGNKVESLFMYVCLLKDRPENGIVVFSPTAGSMSTCKLWNTALRAQRLPSGKIAPIFAFSWNLELAMFLPKGQIDAPGSYKVRFSRATRGEFVALGLLNDYVVPQLQAANSPQVLLLAAPETSGGTEE